MSFAGTTSQSLLRNASSPGRGAIGRPGQPCCPHRPNRAQGGGPCSRWQRLRDCSLPKGAGQAAANRGSGARPFPKSKNFARLAQPLPTRQWLPYQGSCRAVGETERLYRGKRTVIVNLPERVVHHWNPHLEKYRSRLPVCQRAGLRLRWAARCQAWMAVNCGTRYALP